ncbi:hypothetical protein RISK_006182 [Rhodopirellula islandica]|uniref:Uncharacterized protein n=1 Tax=Rhodopirellula islandica TaxID=595434 RepID=A0A0J1B4Y7_RHOIS|nr:hypothetical protein RISK_006182 [Rhodopirellula islandica]
MTSGSDDAFQRWKRRSIRGESRQDFRRLNLQNETLDEFRYVCKTKLLTSFAT